MTVVSLMVALAYENLIQTMAENGEAWALTAPAFFVWCQCLYLINAAAMAWVKLTVDGSTLRLAYTPLDGFGVLLSGIVFIVLARAVGVTNGVVWVAGSAILHLNAWTYWCYQDRRYALDPEAAPAAGIHRSGGRIILIGGAAVTLASGLLHAGRLGFVGAGLALLVAAISMGIGY